MKVYKFGGASINSPERLRSSSAIMGQNATEKKLIVVSAMGKTTNALEQVAADFFAGNSEQALRGFEKIKGDHLAVIASLGLGNDAELAARFRDISTEAEWLMQDKPVRGYDYYYDQIVCCGELLSTAIAAAYLSREGVATCWVDVRDIFRTDNNFRAANIDFEVTISAVNQKIKPLFQKYDLILTQGFIGATDENESTTLGREGSDYSAAVFANLLDAESLTIWKDVEAVMNCDPNKFADAVNIPRLTYAEVIEMAFYGAQVIHPKTIKPLQNKAIPLFVKSFLNPALPGTTINGDKAEKLPPVIVVKKDQAMIKFHSRDFSFIEGKRSEELQAVFSAARLLPNLSQHTAISLICCFDDIPDRVDQIAATASDLFDVEVQRGLQLLTVRHFTEEKVDALIADARVLVQQRTPITIQSVLAGS